MYFNSKIKLILEYVEEKGDEGDSSRELETEPPRQTLALAGPTLWGTERHQHSSAHFCVPLLSTATAFALTQP